MPSLGSLMVCVLASFAVVFNRGSPRLAGHLLASLVLMQMGFGLGWPPFKFVYDHHLLFGLHYLRVVFLYLTIAVTGFAILAAFGIDGIARYFGAPPGDAGWQFPGPRRVVWGTLILAVAWPVGLLNLPTPVAPPIQFALILAGTVGIAILGWQGRARLIPPLLAALLLVECVALRIEPFHVASNNVAAMPESVAAIQKLPDWRDYKVIDVSSAAPFSFLHSDNPDVTRGARRMLSSLSGSTTIRWGLHGMDGSLALPLARRTKLTPFIEAEIQGRGAAAPGLRFIDLLGIRFIATDGPIDTPAFRTFWEGPDHACVMENTAALPRFQVYSRHVSVDSTDAAIDTIANWTMRTLVIENPPGESHQTEMVDADGTDHLLSTPMTVEVRHADSTSYLLEVNAQKPAWLFLADANYPGWKATLDGSPIPLFSAQVLGKAVGIPTGHHVLAITFHSASFTWGLWISIVSAVLTAIAVLYERRQTNANRRGAREMP